MIFAFLYFHIFSTIPINQNVMNFTSYVNNNTTPQNVLEHRDLVLLTSIRHPELKHAEILFEKMVSNQTFYPAKKSGNKTQKSDKIDRMENTDIKLINETSSDSHFTSFRNARALIRKNNKSRNSENDSPNSKNQKYIRIKRSEQMNNMSKESDLQIDNEKEDISNTNNNKIQELMALAKDTTNSQYKFVEDYNNLMKLFLKIKSLILSENIFSFTKKKSSKNNHVYSNNSGFKEDLTDDILIRNVTITETSEIYNNLGINQPLYKQNNEVTPFNNSTVSSLEISNDNATSLIIENALIELDFYMSKQKEILKFEKAVEKIGKSFQNIRETITVFFEINNKLDSVKNKLKCEENLKNPDLKKRERRLIRNLDINKDIINDLYKELNILSDSLSKFFTVYNPIFSQVKKHNEIYNSTEIINGKNNIRNAKIRNKPLFGKITKENNVLKKSDEIDISGFMEENIIKIISDFKNIFNNFNIILRLLIDDYFECANINKEYKKSYETENCDLKNVEFENNIVFFNFLFKKRHNDMERSICISKNIITYLRSVILQYDNNSTTNSSSLYKEIYFNEDVIKPEMAKKLKSSGISEISDKKNKTNENKKTTINSSQNEDFRLDSTTTKMENVTVLNDDTILTQKALNSSNSSLKDVTSKEFGLNEIGIEEKIDVTPLRFPNIKNGADENYSKDQDVINETLIRNMNDVDKSNDIVHGNISVSDENYNENNELSNYNEYTTDVSTLNNVSFTKNPNTTDSTVLNLKKNKKIDSYTSSKPETKTIDTTTQQDIYTENSPASDFYFINDDEKKEDNYEKKNDLPNSLEKKIVLDSSYNFPDGEADMYNVLENENEEGKSSSIVVGSGFYNLLVVLSILLMMSIISY